MYFSIPYVHRLQNLCARTKQAQLTGNIAEISSLLRNHTASVGDCCPMLSDAKWSLLDGSKRPLKRCKPFKDKTTMLSSNICNLSPRDKAPCALRTETSTTPQQKPKTSHTIRTAGLIAQVQPLQKGL